MSSSNNGTFVIGGGSRNNGSDATSGFCPAPPPPPPPPPSVPGQVPALRINAVEAAARGRQRPLSNNIGNDAYEPPAAIQNAMMTKDKKPFTYTPGMGGKLDLSQIRSPRMARRVAKNANDEGIEGPPKVNPASVAETRPSSVATGSSLYIQPQVAVPVFPTNPPPALQSTSINRPINSSTNNRVLSNEAKSPGQTSVQTTLPVSTLANSPPETPTSPAPQVILSKAPTPWLQNKNKPQDELPEWAKRSSVVQGVPVSTFPASGTQQRSPPSSPPGQASRPQECVIPLRIEDRPSVFSIKNNTNQQSQPSCRHQERWGNGNTTTQRTPENRFPEPSEKPRSTGSGTYIVPIMIEGSSGPGMIVQRGGPPSPRTPNDHSEEPGPTMSKSFRVLQKITGTDVPEEDNRKSRELQLAENDRILMNKLRERGKQCVPETRMNAIDESDNCQPEVHGPTLDNTFLVDGDGTYLHEKEDPRYRGAAIPSRAFRYLRNMTDSNDPSMTTTTTTTTTGTTIPVSGTSGSNEKKQNRNSATFEESRTNLPASEQQVPEPKKYTGSAIPSRSFRILQAMMSPESIAREEKDDEEIMTDETENSRGRSVEDREGECKELRPIRRRLETEVRPEETLITPNIEYSEDEIIQASMSSEKSSPSSSSSSSTTTPLKNQSPSLNPISRSFLCDMSSGDYRRRHQSRRRNHHHHHLHHHHYHHHYHYHQRCTDNDYRNDIRNNCQPEGSCLLFYRPVKNDRLETPSIMSLSISGTIVPSESFVLLENAATATRQKTNLPLSSQSSSSTSTSCSSSSSSSASSSSSSSSSSYSSSSSISPLISVGFSTLAHAPTDIESLFASTNNDESGCDRNCDPCLESEPGGSEFFQTGSPSALVTMEERKEEVLSTRPKVSRRWYVVEEDEEEKRKESLQCIEEKKMADEPRWNKIDVAGKKREDRTEERKSMNILHQEECSIEEEEISSISGRSKDANEEIVEDSETLSSLSEDAIVEPPERDSDSETSDNQEDDSDSYLAYSTGMNPRKNGEESVKSIQRVATMSQEESTSDDALEDWERSFEDNKKARSVTPNEIGSDGWKNEPEVEDSKNPIDKLKRELPVSCGEESKSLEKEISAEIDEIVSGEVEDSESPEEDSIDFWKDITMGRDNDSSSDWKNKPRKVEEVEVASKSPPHLELKDIETKPDVDIAEEQFLATDGTSTMIFQLTEAEYDEDKNALKEEEDKKDSAIEEGLTASGLGNLENGRHLLSVQNSREETDDEDSGVTSDMSRLISEVDTDSECLPATRKSRSYKRTQTHSRLFRLLSREEETEFDERSAIIQTGNGGLKSISLRNNCPPEGVPHCPKNSSGASTSLILEDTNSIWNRSTGSEKSPSANNGVISGKKNPRTISDDKNSPITVQLPNWRFRRHVLCPRIKSSKNVPRTMINDNNRSVKMATTIIDENRGNPKDKEFAPRWLPEYNHC